MKTENRRKPLEIYIHIPFCARKCRYCDFLSAPAGEAVREQYVKRLTEEICREAGRYGAYGVSSVFVGGGTPSLLSGEQMGRIFAALTDGFAWEKDPEITVEVNPGTAEPEKLRAYRAAGINRLSIGLQSVREEELRALGRIHTYGQFLQTYESARACGFANLNVDLMSALPGQTPAQWEESLHTVAGLGPEHISAYSLIIEEGTPFYELYGGDRQTEPPLPSEEEERQMYEKTEEILSAYGYERYEISNYARPGFACRHNQGYWERRDYVGFGIGAASLVDNVRFQNGRDLKAYLDGGGNKEDIQILTREEQIEEFLFLGLRLKRGISLEAFRETFGKTLEEVYGALPEKLAEEGLLEYWPDRTGIRLTARGTDLSNYVFAELLLSH